MIDIRFAEDRGTANFGWLDSRHTFSFGPYHDPDHMGFGALRVINEDRVAPKGGFAEHGHTNMEIISYVLDGALEHKDSMGNGTIIKPGDVQRMTAGTGVRHSEYNASDTNPVHFLQIWIEPDQAGLTPGYEQKAFDPADSRNRLRLVASPDGRGSSVTIHQDAALYLGHLEAGAQVTHTLDKGRKAWVQVARGTVQVNGNPLQGGDGAAIRDEDAVILETDDGTNAEVLVFDLA